jgi:hypothetical protein
LILWNFLASAAYAAEQRSFLPVSSVEGWSARDVLTPLLESAASVVAGGDMVEAQKAPSPPTFMARRTAALQTFTLDGALNDMFFGHLSVFRR